MKRFHVICIAILAAFVWTGCSGLAHVEKDKSVNFQNYRTFAWVETKDAQQDETATTEGTATKEERPHKSKVSDLTESHIRQAVNAELEKAGWRQATTQPDVLLSYDVLVEKSIKQENNTVYSRPFSRLFFNPYTRRWGSIYYPSQFLGFDNDAYAVREGTVTISMIDARTDKTIWQGWTTDEVNSKNLTSKEIQNSVRSIFRKFDVAKK